MNMQNKPNSNPAVPTLRPRQAAQAATGAGSGPGRGPTRVPAARTRAPGDTLGENAGHPAAGYGHGCPEGTGLPDGHADQGQTPCRPDTGGRAANGRATQSESSQSLTTNSGEGRKAETRARAGPLLTIRNRCKAAGLPFAYRSWRVPAPRVPFRQSSRTRERRVDTGAAGTDSTDQRRTGRAGQGPRPQSSPTEWANQGRSQPHAPAGGGRWGCFFLLPWVQ